MLLALALAASRVAGAADAGRPRYALLISGAVSRSGGQMQDTSATGVGGAYSDFRLCAATIKKHFLQANPGATWDVFMHSWNPDLEAEFRGLFRFAAAAFEDNEPWVARLRPVARGWFGALSHSVSHAKAARLVLEHERTNGVTYDRFVLTRPDVLTFKDLDLARLRPGPAYCNTYNGAKGDFHFVLGRWHLEAIAANLDRILAAAADPAAAPEGFGLLTSGNGRMRLFLAAAEPGPPAGCSNCRDLRNDFQVRPRQDQEVYRKSAIHGLLACPVPAVREAILGHFVAFYGVSEAATLAAAGKPRCRGQPAVYKAFNFCCNQSRVYDGTFGECGSVCRKCSERLTCM